MTARIYRCTVSADSNTIWGMINGQWKGQVTVLSDESTAGSGMAYLKIETTIDRTAFLQDCAEYRYRINVLEGSTEIDLHNL